METRKPQVDDLMAITPKAMDAMIKHCHPREIPAHNYGKVLSIVTPHSKDSKGRYLHPDPHNAVHGKYDYITIQFPDEVIGFYERDLMLLY